MKPLISILVTTYNHERFIEEAINSILMQQTEYPFEVLIGEDHSTDSTFEKVNALAVKAPGIIKLVRGEKNVGAARNFYETFKACSGKYIAVLDGDDFWTDPLKLQKQVAFMEANPACGFVHADVNHFYESTGKTEYSTNKSKGIIVPDGNLFPELIKAKPLFIKTATACFKKELAERFDFELSIRENWPLQDMPLWMDITVHTQSHYFDEVFATYRLLNESASRTASPAKKYNFHKGLHHIKQLYFAKYNVADEVKKAEEEAYNRGLIRIACMMNDHKVSQEAVNALTAQQASITFKERLLILATKHSWLKQVIGVLKT